MGMQQAEANQFVDKQVLITGGLGFIGSNLAQALVPLGSKVTILDALLEPYGGNEINLRGIEDKIEVIKGNILDQDIVAGALAGKDFVFHLAGQVGYVDAKDKPFIDLDYNGRGMLIMLETLREVAPQARLLFSSSRLVYGKILSLPVREDHPTDPLSLYGIHKLLGEKYIGYYAHEFGINGLSVRIPNPYGPRQQMKHSKYSIVGWFVRQAMEGKIIQVFGDGQQERDYIYIDDIVAAMLQLMIKGEVAQTYNLGSEERVNFQEMVKTVIEVVGQGKIEQVSWPADYERNETGDYIADTSKIRQATGWLPKVKLKDGLQSMVDYYSANRKYYW